MMMDDDDDGYYPRRIPSLFCPKVIAKEKYNEEVHTGTYVQSSNG